MKRIFFLFFLILYSVSAYSASVHIFGFDIKNYPQIKAKIYAVDDNGIPINNLNINDFKIIENSNNCSITELSCPTQSQKVNQSVVLMYDLSLDTNKYSDNLLKLSNFYLSTQIGQIFLERVENNTIEMAISSFDFKSYLNKDFELINSANRSSIINVLNKLKYYNSSDYQTGFLDIKTGSLDIHNKAKFKKSIILFSDGIVTTNYQLIIQKLKENNIRVFSVSFSDTLSNSLKEIAEQTGGFAFYGIKTTDESKRIGEILLSYINNYQPCELTWNSVQDCNNQHNSQLNFNKTINSQLINAKKKFSFYVDEKYKPSIETYGPDGKSYLRFSSVIPGNLKDLNLRITPTNGIISINKLRFDNTDANFKIVSGDISNSITLNPGDTHRVSIRFTPIDSAIEFTKLIIESNACYGTEVLITGGFPNKEPKPNKRTLKIINPKEGDVLIVNDSINIEWTGLLPADVIQLEYSLDNGRNFDTLAYDINSGNEKTMEYLWKIPDLVSDSCRIRAIQLWPNNIGQTLDLKHNSSVNCATFNSEGTLVATCTNDSMAYIWNSNTGKMLDSLVGHTKEVNWIEFDHLENTKYVVSASEDKTAIIFNVSDGKIHKILSGHKDRLNSCQFNKTSDQIITSSTDGMVLRWDVATGKLIDTLVNGSSIQFVTFTPDFSKICVVYNSDAKLIDVSSKKVLKTYKMGLFGNQHASVSKDQKLVSISSKTGYVGIFDLETEALKFNIIHNDSLTPVNSSSFSDDGEIILTSGIDFKVKMWSSKDGTKYGNTFDEHLNSVRTAYFNFDKSRVLSSSWDSTAKIWKLDKKDIQIDTTGIFRIGKPKIIVKDIDFGNVAFNESKDTLLTKFIINSKDFAYKIQDIKFINNNSESFSIKDYFAPFIIQSEDTIKIKLRFIPKDLGLKTAQIEILYQGGNKELLNLSGNGIIPPLQANQTLVDFGTEEIGEFRDTSITLFAKNNTNSNLSINKITIEFPDSTHFKLISNDITSISANSSIGLKIRYIPEFIRRDNGVLKIYHSGELSPTTVNLYGEGLRGTIDTITFYIDESQGTPGEQITIPIKYKNISEFGIDDKLEGFEFKMQFNATLLEPTFAFEDLSINDNIATIKFNTNKFDSQKPSIKDLTFKVGLGNDTIDHIKIIDVVPLGYSRLKIYFEDNWFKLLGLCKEGAVRLFYSDNRISLSQNIPNPVSDITKINYEILEPGETKIIITDLMGNTIFEPLNQYLVPGKYEQYINLSDLNPGIYNYFLITPSHKLVKKLQIIK